MYTFTICLFLKILNNAAETVVHSSVRDQYNTNASMKIKCPCKIRRAIRCVTGDDVQQL